MTAGEDFRLLGAKELEYEEAPPDGKLAAQGATAGSILGAIIGAYYGGPAGANIGFKAGKDVGDLGGHVAAGDKIDKKAALMRLLGAAASASSIGGSDKGSTKDTSSGSVKAPTEYQADDYI